MKFNPAESDENFFMRFVSLEGKWEIGLTRMIFGVRVRLGQVGSESVVLDYCAGADISFQIELLQTVMTILIPIEENISPNDLYNMFPSYKVKPINNDPCWPKLQEMANKVLHSV